jgi:hypothetical protein
VINAPAPDFHVLAGCIYRRVDLLENDQANADEHVQEEDHDVEPP